MTQEKKQLEVVLYDSNWPAIFAKEEKVIKNTLKDNCLELYHIGSTSVPTLKAKPVIDMIVVIKDPDLCITQLESIDYVYKGELNIPFRLYFTKKENPAVHLHVYEAGNPEIELNLLFRDCLRNNAQVREEYAVLKTKLLTEQGAFQKNSQGLMEYTLGKDAFIRKLLVQKGFNGLRLLFCAHYLEWEAYHRIREEQLFQPINVPYDRNHPSLTAPNCYHFILSVGTTIVSVAMLEFLNKDEVALRTIATDVPYRRKGYATQMLHFLEKWAKRQGGKVMKTHANLNAEPFYRKRGYVDMHFDDVSIAKNIIDLGKAL